MIRLQSQPMAATKGRLQIYVYIVLQAGMSDFAGFVHAEDRGTVADFRERQGPVWRRSRGSVQRAPRTFVGFVRFVSIQHVCVFVKQRQNSVFHSTRRVIYLADDRRADNTEPLADNTHKLRFFLLFIHILYPRVRGRGVGYPRVLTAGMRLDNY